MDNPPDTSALYDAYFYNPLTDEALLDTFRQPPADQSQQEGPAEGQAQTSHMTVATRYDRASAPDTSPSRIPAFKLALKLSSAASPSSSALRVDRASLARNDDEKIENIAPFERHFANAISDAREAMALLDREGRSLLSQGQSAKSHNASMRQQALDSALSQLSANLSRSRGELHGAFRTWIAQMSLAAGGMQRDFDKAATKAKRDLADRKDEYDRDINPVVETRQNLISRIIEGEEELYSSSRAAVGGMETAKTTPETMEFSIPDTESESSDAQNAVRSMLGDNLAEIARSALAGRRRLERQATREAIVEFIPGRAEYISTQLSVTYGRLAEGLLAQFRCIPCKIDTGLVGIAGFVLQVSEIGPEQVESLLTTSHLSLNTAVSQLSESAQDAAESADENLVAAHDNFRETLFQSAELETEAEAQAIEAQIAPALARLEIHRDALPQTAEGVRERIEAIAASKSMTPAEFAAQAIQACAGLVQQVQKIVDREPAAAGLVIEQLKETLEERLLVGDRIRRTEIREAHSSQAETIREASEGVSGQVADAMKELKPMIGHFADTAASFLPNVEEGYNQAVYSMEDALYDAERAVDIAMVGHSNKTARPQESSSGGGGGDSTSAAATPGSCDGCGPNSSELPDDTSDAVCSEDPGMSTLPAAPTSEGGQSIDPGMSLPAEPMSPVGYSNRMRSIAATPMQHDIMTTLVTDAQSKVPPKLRGKAEKIEGKLDVTLNADIDAILGEVEGITKTHGDYFIEYYGTDDSNRTLKRSFRHFAWNEFSLPATITQKIRTFNRSLEGDVVGAAIARLNASMVAWNDSATMESVMQNLTPQQLAAMRRAPPAELAELREGMSREEREVFNQMLAGDADEVRATSLRREIDQLRWNHGVGERGSEKIFNAIRTTAQQTGGSKQTGGWAAEGDASRYTADMFELELPEIRQARQAERWTQVQESFGTLTGVSRLARTGPRYNATENAVGPNTSTSQNTDSPDSDTPETTGGSTDGATLLSYAFRDRLRFRRAYDENGRATYEQYATAADPEYIRAAEMLLRFGVDSEQAAAAELYAETHRSRGNPRPDVMRRLLQPSSADAQRMGGYDQNARANGLDAAEERRRRIFELYGRFAKDSENRDDAPNAAAVQNELNRHINSAFDDDPYARRMMNGWVNSARGDPLATMEYAIENENLDVARAQLGRMDRTEIDAMLTQWGERYPNGPSFEEAMGLGQHRFNATDFFVPVLLGPAGFAVNQMRGANYNWGAAFSGDEANELEILMNGVPQNEFEAGHVALRIMDQQIEQSTWAGQLVAGDEYERLVENANDLRRMMGTADVELDSMGRISATDPATNQPVIVGNFNTDGSFSPPRGYDAGDFSVAMSLARFHADSYTQAVDQAANFIATAIVLTAAIVTTFLTGGAAASLWIPALVTLGAGVLAMGTTAMLKGSRYSKDQMLTDLATNIVSAATAGLGSAATVYLRGAMISGAAGRAALGGVARNWRMSERALAAVARSADKVDDAARLAGGAAGMTDDAIRVAASSADDIAQLGQPKMWQNMLVGGFSGGASGATAAAMDPRFKNSEDYWENVFHGFGRGFAGGAAGAGITEAAMKGGARILQNIGRGRATRLAAQMNLSERQMAEFIVDNTEAFASRGYMDILNRSLAGGISGAASKGIELEYERFLQHKRIRSASMIEDMFWAGLQNAFQSGAEGVAEGTRRRHVSGDDAEHRWVESQGRAEQVEGQLAQQRLQEQAANDNDVGAARTGDPGDNDAAFLPDLTSGTPLTRQAGSGLKAAGDGADGVTARVRSLIDTDPPTADDILAASRTPSEVSLEKLIDHRAAKIPYKEDQPLLIRANLAGQDAETISPISAGSRVVAANAHDHAAALVNYNLMRRASLNREVGLFHHPVDGYVVVQGFHAQVAKPRNDYTMLRHSHPSYTMGGQAFEMDVGALLARILPSGQDGDMGVLQADLALARARAAAGETATHESQIDIMVDGQHYITTYAARDTADGPVFDINFRNPLDQDGGSLSFQISSHVEYHSLVLTLTGHPIRPLSVAEAVARSLADGSPAMTPDVMRALRDTALAPHERSRIAEFADGMKSVDNFARQLAGDMPPGGLDPATGLEFSRQFADQQLRDLGLIGQPDSVVRLHRILNDTEIPFHHREQLATRVREVTEVQMRQQGLLGADEPLILLYHGRRSPLDDAIAHRAEGGEREDLGNGLYVSQDLASAYLYDGRHPDGPDPSRPGRGRGPNGDKVGEVLPFFVRGNDIGELVDVQPGGPHHAAWMDYLDGTPRRYPAATNGPHDPFLGFPTTRDYLDSIMGSRDFNEGRGRIFQDFLDTTNGVPSHPDLILGELGGFLSGGISLHGAPTDQGAIRSQRIFDHLNLQHGFSTLGARDAVRWPMPQAGGPIQARAIGGDDTIPTLSAKTQSGVDDAGTETPEQRRTTRVADFDEAFAQVLQHSQKAKDLQALHDRLDFFLTDTEFGLLKQLAMEPDQAKARALVSEIAATLQDDYGADVADLQTVTMPKQKLLLDIIQLATQLGSPLRRVADTVAADRASGTSTATDVGDTAALPASGRWTRYAKLLIRRSEFARQLAVQHPDQFETLVARFEATDDFKQLKADSPRDVGALYAERFADYARHALPQLRRNDEAAWSGLSLPDTASGPAARSFAISFEDAGDYLDVPVIGTVPRLQAAAARESEQTHTGTIEVGDDIIIHGIGPATVTKLEDGTMTVLPRDGSGETTLVVTRQPSSTAGETVAPQNRFATDPDPDNADARLPVVAHASGEDRQEMLGKINRFRRFMRLADYSGEASGTISIARGGGKEAFGINATLAASQLHLHPRHRRELQKLLSISPDFEHRFIHHAEAASLFRLRSHLEGETMPKIVELFVDRPTCSSCIAHLGKLATHLGIEELQVHVAGVENTPPLVIRAR